MIRRVAREIKRAQDASQNPALGVLIGHSTVDGFAMGFAANLHAVDLNPGMIHPLLKQARAIFDADTPPTPREGCIDCARVDELIAAART